MSRSTLPNRAAARKMKACRSAVNPYRLRKKGDPDVARCDDPEVGLQQIEPIVIAASIEHLGTIYSLPT